jgi:hypothetical protein
MKQQTPSLKPLERRKTQVLAPHLRIALLIAICFGTAVTLVGWSVGAHLLVPNEKLSIALGFSAALPIALGFFCYVVTFAVLALLRRDRQAREPLVWIAGNDLALLLIFVVISYFHFNLKMWLPLINPALFDAEFMATDAYFQWLIDASTRISVAVHDLYPFKFRLYQYLFLGSFIVAFCNLAARRDEYYPQFAIGIFLVLSLGGFSYLIMPAVGPFIFEPGAQAMTTENQDLMYINYQSVQEHGVQWVNQWGGRYFTGSLAAMPSLHVAHATVMTYYMFKSRASLFPLFPILWVWVVIESVALRWHYVVDDIAGFFLAVLIIRFVHVLFSNKVRVRDDAASQTTVGYSD